MGQTSIGIRKAENLVILFVRGIRYYTLLVKGELCVSGLRIKGLLSYLYIGG